MVKGAALFLQQGSSGSSGSHKSQPHHKHAGRRPAGIVCNDNFILSMAGYSSSWWLVLLLLFSGDLPQHLQVMINILRSEDRIKLVREHVHPPPPHIHTRMLPDDPLAPSCSAFWLLKWLCWCLLPWRQYGWRAPGLSGSATWWWCTPTGGRTPRRTSYWEWTSPARTGEESTTICCCTEEMLDIWTDHRQIDRQMDGLLRILDNDMGRYYSKYMLARYFFF